MLNPIYIDENEEYSMMMETTSRIVKISFTTEIYLYKNYCVCSGILAPSSNRSITKAISGWLGGSLIATTEGDLNADSSIGITTVTIAYNL